MRRRLVLYLLLPHLVVVPPLLATGYLFARHAFTRAAMDTAAAATLEQVRSIAARLPLSVGRELEARCRDEVQGSAIRLTVIARDGRVLCDTAADRGAMVNHLQRPEVARALATGIGFDHRESATLHAPFLYVAVRAGDAVGARVVRLAIPLDILEEPERSLDTVLVATFLVTGAVVVLLAFVFARRASRRLERMIGFSRAVATGDFTARLPSGRSDELGVLETNLNAMGERVRDSFLTLRAESETLRGVLTAMVEGVVVVSHSGEIVVINRRAEEIFGLPSGPEYRGHHLLEMCRDPELQSLLRGLTSRADDGARQHEITLGEGERRVLAVSVSPRHDAPGGAVFVLVFHDVSNVKRLETMRQDLIANVSHELRTPLTAIRGYAETLLGGALSDRARARQFLSVIDRHAERLSRLTDDLLTLSDLELGKTALKKEPVVLEVLVDDVLEVVAEKAQRGQVALHKSIPADLPLLLGDPDRLQQVLINLADNAVKYTPPGGRVTIAARVADGAGPMVEVEVQDTGIGIPAADLPRLTERFYRVDKARSRELGGTGLGLAIVKHIVQAHNGRLHIASEVNLGTTVRFSLPVWAAGAQRGSAA